MAKFGTTEVRTPAAGAAASVQPPPMDWGRGHYERTAERLLPAARAVVDAGRLQRGDRVLDVGSGTGNVALIAARAGARVTGVDPASRLLEVARDEAVRDGLQVEFLQGDAAALPVSDQSFDAVLSNFAVIFSPDPKEAAAELVRVLAPGGRIVLSAWVPGGTMSRFSMTAQALVGEAVGMPPQPPPFAWHELGSLTKLFAAHGLRPNLTSHEIAFAGTSPQEYLEDDRQNHPMAIAGFEVLQQAGRAETARETLLRILVEGNEDPSAFLTTERYVVITAKSA